MFNFKSRQNEELTQVLSASILILTREHICTVNLGFELSLLLGLLLHVSLGLKLFKLLWRHGKLSL